MTHDNPPASISRDEFSGEQLRAAYNAPMPGATQQPDQNKPNQQQPKPGQPPAPAPAPAD